MTKKFIIIFIFSSFLTHAQTINSSGKFTISGKILGKDSGRLCLSYLNSNNIYINDTVYFVSGEFEISGLINEPTIASIKGDIKSRSVDDSCFAEFYLEPKKIKIEIVNNNFKNLIVFGSQTQNDFLEIETLKSSIYKELNELNFEFSKTSALFLKNRDNEILLKKRDSLLKCFEPYNVRQRNIELQFIESHPRSYIDPVLLWYQARFLSIDSLTHFYNLLNEPIRKSSWGKKIGDIIQGQPGFLAKNFISNDLNGNEIELSSFRGSKIILLDFWATWCAPCRENNPHLREVYSKYKSKGFEIIGIADDDNRIQAWKNAIKNDKINVWYQILQNNGSNNNLGKLFGVLIIPTKILINKNGVIIGRYEGNNDLLLDNKLKEIFDN